MNSVVATFAVLLIAGIYVEAVPTAVKSYRSYRNPDPDQMFINQGFNSEIYALGTFVSNQAVPTTASVVSSGVPNAAYSTYPANTVHNHYPTGLFNAAPNVGYWPF